MAKLQQIQIQHSATDDRLIMRIGSDNGEECRVWLTRRVTRLLWPKLLECLQKDQQVALQTNSEAKQALLSFKHNEAVAKADYKTRYEERDDRSFPLGKAPILPTKISVRATENGYLLSLHPQQGQGIELALSQQLLHALCKLLADTTAKAEWDLDLQISGANSPAEQPSVMH